MRGERRLFRFLAPYPPLVNTDSTHNGIRSVMPHVQKSASREELSSDRATVKFSGRESSTSQVQEHLRLAALGEKIVNTLKESHRSTTVSIPPGVSDRDALDALNAYALKKLGREIFAEKTLESLMEVPQNHHGVSRGARSHNVTLLVDDTASRSFREVGQKLAKRQLERADPVATAIALAVTVIDRGGESPVGELGIRTTSPHTTLYYLEVKGQVLALKTDPNSRNEGVWAAGSPIKRGATGGFFGLGALFR